MLIRVKAKHWWQWLSPQFWRARRHAELYMNWIAEQHEFAKKVEQASKEACRELAYGEGLARIRWEDKEDGS